MNIEELRELARVNSAGVCRECEDQLMQGRAPEGAAGVEFAAVHASAAYDVGDLPEAMRALDRGFAAAGSDMTASVVELAHILGMVRTAQGAPELALGPLESLLVDARGEPRAVLRMVLGIVCSEMGRGFDALKHYQLGLRSARLLNLEKVEMGLLNNRAVSHLERGRFTRAEADFACAAAIGERLDDPFRAAVTKHNVGVLRARQGNLSQALALFEESGEVLRTIDAAMVLAPARLDQAKLFLDAGLLDESLSYAEKATAIYAANGAPRRWVEAVQLEARILAAKNRWADAAAQADLAAKRARNAGLDDSTVVAAESLHASLSVVAALEAALEAGEVPRADSPLLSPDRFRNQPEVAVDAGLLLSAGGHHAAAVKCLTTAIAAPDSSSALMQLHRAVGHAEIAHIRGDSAGARSAVVDAITDAASQALSLGATEMRTMANRRLAQLRQIGVEIEVDAGKPLAAVAIRELERSAVLIAEPELSPHERALVTRLRSVNKSLRKARPDSDQEAMLRQRRKDLERELRRGRRQQVESGDSPVAGAGTAAAEIAWSSTEATIYMMVTRRDVHMVVLSPDGGVTLLPPVGREELRKVLSACVFNLVGSAVDRPMVALWRKIRELRRLLGPVGVELSRYERAVVVPDPLMDQIPWALISPTPVTQFGSLGQWRRSARAARRRAKGPEHRTEVVAISGPRLEFSAQEVQSICDKYPNARGLVGAEATSAAALDAMSTARTLHFAAHGTFQASNALVSAVELADGPLTFFDLRGGGQLPERMIFSACDLGRSAVETSLGLASLLSGRGCRSFIASNGLANDQSALALMSGVHERLADGEAMADALTGAQLELVKTVPSVARFSTFGVG